MNTPTKRLALLLTPALILLAIVALVRSRAVPGRTVFVSYDPHGWTFSNTHVFVRVRSGFKAVYVASETCLGPWTIWRIEK